MNSDIILASGSPRRKDLLTAAHLSFTVHSADVDETPPVGMPSEDVPAYLAQKKAAAVAGKYPNAVIIAADTIVLLEGEIIGKPRDTADAAAMLRKLSGKRHIVITGVCIRRNDQADVFSQATDVYFRELTETQIRFYVDTYKPMDKAGSYAIQEFIGMIGIEKIDGDYYNVMGLPIGEVVRRLAMAGYA